jgi:hypothetical protein
VSERASERAARCGCGRASVQFCPYGRAMWRWCCRALTCSLCAQAALELAAENGHTGTVTELVRLGADPNAKNGVGPAARITHACGYGL